MPTLIPVENRDATRRHLPIARAALAAARRRAADLESLRQAEAARAALRRITTATR